MHQQQRDSRPQLSQPPSPSTHPNFHVLMQFDFKSRNGVKGCTFNTLAMIFTEASKGYTSVRRCGAGNV
jgi:hypothetical protein